MIEYPTKDQYVANFFSYQFEIKEIIYNIQLLYYFIAIILSHQIVKKSFYQNIMYVLDSFDVPSDKLTSKQKSIELINLLSFCKGILYYLVYVGAGLLFKLWIISKLHTSSLYLTMMFDKDCQYSFECVNQYDIENMYILSGMIFFTIVSRMFDVQLIKKSFMTKFISIFKDLVIGALIFNSNNDIMELIKQNHFMVIGFEFVSFIISFVVPN